MSNPLNIFINEDVLESGGSSDKFSDRLDRGKLEYLQVKNLDQFDRLISVLKDDIEVVIWVHPNNAMRKSLGFSSTAEQDIAYALKKRGNIKFNLVTRMIDDDMTKLAKDLGVNVYKTSDIWDEIGKIPSQKASLIKAEIESKSGVRIKPKLPKVDYAIICALYEDEFEMVEDFLENAKIVPGFDSCKIGTLKGSDKKVLIDFQVQMGMVNCAVLTTQILELANPKYLILCGVCGGRKAKKVNILDLIIPNKVFEYHTGKYENGKVKPYLRVSNINNKAAIQAKTKILEEMKKYVNPPLKTAISNIKVHTKTMACGNWVVKGKLLEQSIAKKDEEVVGLEMESYGFATAAELCESKTKVFVIKSVMDLTDSTKNDANKTFAGFISACYAYFLIKDHL